MGDIKRMFNPETIALIGATDREGSIGRIVFENLILSKGRRIFPVNPGKKELLGLTCYPDIVEIPDHIDLAIVVVPAMKVPQCVEGCGKARVDGIIIISSGFREVGEEGKKLEEEIIEIRKEYGMEIIGPNCLGIIRPPVGLNATFLNNNPEPGNIAFISHSGALGSAIIDWAVNASIGFSMFASLGSMLDIDFGDMIDFLGDDPYTRSILIYMEGVGNARKFMSAARGFARNKPVIILKPGKFSESARAALSHTGSLVGDDQVYDAAFKRAGAVRIKETADLFNTAEVLDFQHLPHGRRLVIVTNAGGVGIMATDELIDLGGELARLSQETIEALNKFLPSFWSRGNPVDVLGDATIERYTMAINQCLQDNNVDALLIIYTPQGSTNPEELAEAIASVAKRSQKPIIATLMGGKTIEKAKTILLHNNIPTYGTPEEAIKTYLYMYKYSRNLELLYETPADLPVDQAPPKNNLKALIKRVLKEDRIILTEVESKNFLTTYGIPVIPTYMATNVDSAVNIANKIGYPVVIKILSPQITHKSDLGGVIIGINSDDAMRDAYYTMMDNINKKAPHYLESIQGVTVQRQLEKIDYEIILGTKKDKDFGSVIVFGLGGIETEIIKKIAIGLPPMNQTLARRLIEDSGTYEMLQGYRGKKPADMKLLEQAIVSFSNLIVDFPEIGEMEINPLGISNGKPYALDARIILDSKYTESSLPYPHLVITPYPTRHIISWRLTDGREVTLRPIRPEDEPLEHEMLSTLSEKTMRERFFSVIKDITHGMLIRFCNIDYDREMAIVAEIKEGNRKRIIGISRLILDSDLKSGEFAVLVHDDFHSKGLGYKLVDMIIGIAQEKGLDNIYGIVLSDNERMLRLCRKLGFVSGLPCSGVTRITLTLK